MANDLDKGSNKALWARRERAIPRGLSSLHQRFATSAHNSALVDAEGREYIDFATGIAVCNTGHSDPRIVAAVKAQLDRFSHLCFQVTPYESYVELAEKLNALAPGPTPKKTIFLTTGAEALENAVKIARAHTGRRGIITFQGGYHGRTLLTMAMTGKVAPYKARYGPMPADVFHVRFPIPYHGFGDEDALAGLQSTFAASIEPAAVDRAGRDSGHHHRAGARRGRLLRGLALLHAVPAQALRPARHPAGVRRGAERLRAHWQAVRL